MSTLVETISDALIRLGPSTQARLRDIFAELTGLNLGEVERLSVLATALAAVAMLHHARHKFVYLEAVRVWSVEMSVARAAAPARLASLTSDILIAEGAEIVVGGLDRLIEALAGDAIRLQDRLVLELALFAQLLGQHHVNAVHVALMAVAEALGDEEYRPGHVLLVPLEEMAVPVTRDVCLATVAPRGVA